jgi:RNA polymerase sigma factor (sigma-70 family)
MTKAFVALQKETRDFEILPWMFRIVHNESVSLLRQRRPTVDFEQAERIGQDDLAQSVSDRAALAQLQTDLKELGERQRGALVMRELSGLAHKDIAAALNCSTAAAKQAIFEARSALTEMAEGREMRCEAVQRALSDNDGRVVRGRMIRSHLRDCEVCSGFRAAMVKRPKDLAAISPAIPAVGAAAILSNVLAGAHAGAAATGAAGAGAGATAGTVIAGGAVGKTIAVVAATAVVAGGAVTANKVATHHKKTPAVSTITSQTVPPSAAKAATQPSGASSNTGKPSKKTSTSSSAAKSAAAAAGAGVATGKSSAPGQVKKTTGATKATGKAKAKAKVKAKVKRKNKGKATAPGQQKKTVTVPGTQVNRGNSSNTP